MHSEKIDVLFLVESDTEEDLTKKYYKIPYYETYLPLQKDGKIEFRIISLVSERVAKQIKVREDLMSCDFPAIFLEYSRGRRKSLVIGGFYREWTERRLVDDQLAKLDILMNNISKAREKNCDLVLVGDANLCSRKWHDHDYDWKRIVEPWKLCLADNGLESLDMGLTYTADHAINGKITTSAIDHAYISTPDSVKAWGTLQESSTDHLPIFVDIVTHIDKPKEKVTYRRVFKHFTQAAFVADLAVRAVQPWYELI